MTEHKRDKIIEKTLGLIAELEWNAEQEAKINSSTVNGYCSLFRKMITKLKSDDE